MFLNLLNVKLQNRTKINSIALFIFFSLYNDISDVMIDLTATINEQYDYNGNTYEICNKTVNGNITKINFTMNMNILNYFSYNK